jgi:tRNA pseudouridine55 synthase
MHPDLRALVQYSGILAVDKPRGKTSADIVNLVKRSLRRESGQKIRVGHAGTLDPLATGVLLLCCGLATKAVPWLHEFSKTYLAGFTLGGRSDTDDSVGAITASSFSGSLNEAVVEAALEQFIGDIRQVPPAYSAVQVGGKRAYKMARRGEALELAPRTVTVHEIQLINFDWPKTVVRVVCSSGTYIRSIARDLGEALGCGGYMHSLVRTAIGPFSLENCLAVAALEPGSLQSRIQPLAGTFPAIPRVVASEQDLMRLRDGKHLALPGEESPRVLITSDDGSFVAVVEKPSIESGEYAPVLNWAPVLYAKT